jgi:zinc/manganese transport system permease protein
MNNTFNWHAVDWSIVGPALIAGLLVLSTHVPLGRQAQRHRLH